MTLAPEIVKQLADQKAAGLPQVWEAPVAVIRELTQGRVAFAGVPEPILSVTNRFIQAPLQICRFGSIAQTKIRTRLRSSISMAAAGY